MTISTDQTYETYPKPTLEELENAELIIAEALQEFELEPKKTAQQIWREFEEVREEIIRQYNNVICDRI